MPRSRFLKHPPNPRLGVSPEGTLLEFIGELTTDFGFAYERFLNFEKSSHLHERFVFCAARGNCSFEVTELKTGKTFVNSKVSTVFKAPGSLHSLKCRQTVYENLVFLPTAARLRAVFQERNYRAEHWTPLNSGIRQVRRSPWFDALVERYFHMRVFSPQDALSRRDLENEILREILVLALGEPAAKPSAEDALPMADLSPPLRRALEAIELSLFSSLELEEISKVAGVSRASLLRAFKRDLNLSPMAYLRRRRLEEARRLLLKKMHTVTEVAYLVGYENTSAFCRAYKAHFGAAPRDAT